MPICLKKDPSSSKSPKSISARLNRIFLVFIVLTIISVSIVSIFTEYHEIKNESYKNMIDTLTTVDGIIGYYIHYYDKKAAELLTMVSPNLSNEELIKLVRRVFSNLQRGDIIYLLDEKRNLFFISNNDGRFIGMNLANLDNVKKYQTISAVHRSLFMDKLVVTILYPVPKNRMLLIDKNLDALTPVFEKFSSQRLNRKDFLFILYKDNVIVYHPDTELRGKKVDFIKTLKKLKQFGQKDLYTYNYNGKKYLSAYIKSIHAINWSLYYNIPFEVFKSRIIADTFIKTTVYLVLTVLLLLGLNRVIYLRITRPISEISSEIKGFDISRNSVAQLKEKGGDSKELLDIIEAIDTMCERMKGSFKEFAEKEFLLKTLSEFSKEMIFWLEPRGKIKYISPACKDITGYEEKDFYKNAELIHEIVHPLDRDRWDRHFKDIKSVKVHESIELRITTKKGDIKWVSHTCRPVYSDDGEFLGIVGSNYDISDKKELMEIIEEQKHIAKKSVRGDTVVDIKEGTETSDKKDIIKESLNKSKRRILVMDDEDIVRDMISSMLEHLGYDVNTVEKGEDAINEYKHSIEQGRKYDLVILDMIVKDGLGAMEVIKELKKIDPSVKAIAASGYSDSMGKDFRTQGFQAVLTKPFRLEGFKDLLKTVLKVE